MLSFKYAFSTFFAVSLLAASPALGQSVTILSGNGQVAQQAFLTLDPLVVLVKNQAGQPVPNVTVQWSVSPGPGCPAPCNTTGNVTATQTVTDSMGQASTFFVGALVLQPNAYSQSLITASALGAHAAFTATTIGSSIQGEPFIQIFLDYPTVSDVVSGPAGGVGATPIKVRVLAAGTTAQANQGIPNVAVAVATNNPGPGLPSISCLGGTVFTDLTGTALCTPLFGSSAGSGQRFTVFVGGEYREFSFNAFTVTAVTGCVYSLSPNASFTAGGGTGALSVTTQSGCSWTAASNVNWITITAGSSGTGGGTVNFTVGANSGAQRTGTITVAGLTFTVTQTGLTTAGLRFVPVRPCRVMDTRGGIFGGSPIPGTTSRSVSITQSACNIPVNAQAYALNVTVVPSGPLGYLSIWPTGQPQPVVSTLNSWDGRVVANAAIVPAGTTGSITIYVSNTTDVILDINGYFAPASTPNSLAFYPLAPCRVADTRGNGFSGFSGAFGPPFLTGGASRSFPILSSSCGIPSTAQAYSLNFTVVPFARLSYLTAWPAGQSQPLVSTLNSYNGDIVANAAIVPAGAGSAISVFVTDNTDLIIDIDGYFAPPGASNGQSFYTLPPCRVADTRGNGFTGPFGPPGFLGGGTKSYPIPLSSCAVPSGAQAYSLNFTVVPPGPLSYLTAWPAGQPQPLVSTLNSFNGKVVANAAIVPAGQLGSISVFATNTTDLIIDINGYFGP